jgi:prepilin-type processing-associated H-X9-DG protein
MLWKDLVKQRPVPSDFKGDNKFSYLRKTLFICPRAEEFEGWLLNDDAQKYGYSMNASLPAAPQTNKIPGPTIVEAEFKAMGKVKTPSAALLAADGVAVSVTAGSAGNKSMIGGPATSVFDMAARPDQQNRHYGKLHCLLCDGSVQPYRWVNEAWTVDFSAERWSRSNSGGLAVPMPPLGSDMTKPETWPQRVQLFWYGRTFVH